MIEKNKIYYLAILLLIISIFTIFTSLYIKNNIIIKKEKIYASLLIGKSMGFDLNSTALIFGRITPGGTGIRKLNIDNTYNLPIIVEIKTKGDISQFLVFKKYTHIGANKTKTITINAIAPQNATFGNYSGNIILIIKKDI